MNFIPSTFDEHQIKRAIFGGKKDSSIEKMNISVILLNSSGSHLKLNVFENLIKCNFDTIISIEPDSENYSIDEVSQMFPEVKFMIPLEKTNDGDMINLAMSEIKTDFVLVLRDSLNIPSGFLLNHLAANLTQNNIYCIAPWLMDKKLQVLPVHFTPGAEKSHFVIDSSVKINDRMKTVYPFDYIGLYNRKKFIELGGYDFTINSPYWQNLDLSIRAWLWGEEIRLSTVLQFSYLEEAPIADSTINLDYLKYYLKNEVPRYKEPKAFISNSFFHKFRRRSSCGFIEARKQFKAAQKWVERNQYRFKMDLQTFIQNWDKTDE